MKSVAVSTLGYGYIGKVHTIAYQNLPLCYNHFPYDIKLKTLVSSRRIEEGRNFPYQNVTNKISDIAETDFVDICTPNFAHYDEIVQLDQMGVKNIYCEKPLAGFLEEEKKLVALAEKQHINNQVALVFRFIPAVIRAKKLIEEGVVGDIIHFKSCYYHDSYLDIQKPFTWRNDREKSGGGALVDLGIHVLDMLRYVLGDARKVSGYAKTVIKKRPFEGSLKDVDVDDFAHLDLELESGAQGTVEVSRVSVRPTNDIVFEIFGTKGSITINTAQPEYPQIYIFGKGRMDGSREYVFNDVQSDINYLWPSGKGYIGLLPTAHMASINCFISRLCGKKFEYIKVPTFKDSLESIKVVECIYRKLTEIPE